MEFGFGVDDAAVVATTTSLTVDKLPEASEQLDLVDSLIAERDLDLDLICKRSWISFLSDIQE